MASRFFMSQLQDSPVYLRSSFDVKPITLYHETKGTGTPENGPTRSKDEISELKRVEKDSKNITIVETDKKKPEVMVPPKYHRPIFL